MPQDEIIHRNILESMSDGVMTIGTDGRILTFNQAAERILAQERTAALGRSLGEVFFAREGTDEFTQTVLNAIYEPDRVHDSVVSYHDGTGALRLSVRTSFLQAEAGETSRTAAVIVVFSDVTEMERLRQTERQLGEEIQAKHKELQGSYVDLESTTRSLQAALRKVRVVRLVAAAFLVVIALPIGYFAWQQRLPMARPAARPPQGRPASATSAAGPGGSAARVMTVAPRALSDGIALRGNLRPVKVVNVTSPFNGTVLERLVEYGQAIERGHLLLRLDTAELEVKLREATATHIRAVEKLNQLLAWKDSDEVAKTRRSLTRARLTLDAQRKTLEETERLHAKGIIPASELTSAQQQVTNARMDHESAEQELKIVLTKGEGENLGIAKLELENARQRLEELKAQLAQAEIAAPVSGTILLPDAAKEGKGKAMEKGVSFSQGEVLLAIGDTAGLSVTAEVDEMEVLRIRPGQEARITGDAFPGIALKGSIAHVSSQAGKGGDGQKKAATFELTAVVERLSPAERERVRMGMSCNLEILLLHKAEAILIPVPAVIVEGAARFVMVRDKRTGEFRKTKVETGVTTPDAVEIVNGLRSGDEIALEN